MTPSVLAALALALLPTLVEACATCLDSAYGDRSFNRAFALFMLTPFAVAAAVVAVLARQLGVRQVAPAAGPPDDAVEGIGESSPAEGSALDRCP